MENLMEIKYKIEAIVELENIIRKGERAKVSLEAKEKELTGLIEKYWNDRNGVR